MRTRVDMSGFTMLEIMIVVSLIAALMIIAMPGFIRSREVARQGSCQENLLRIDGAIQQYILENNLVGSMDLSSSWPDEFVGSRRFIRSMPKCPSGGTYSITFADDYEPVKCTILGGEFPHVLPQVLDEQNSGS